MAYLCRLKYFKYIKENQKRLDKWYSYLESHCRENPHLILRNQADIENKKQFKYISRVPHNYFWATILIFVIASGIYFILLNPTYDSPNKPTINSTIVIIKEGDKIGTVYQKKDTLESKR